MKKNLICILLAGCLLVTVLGCSEKTSTSSNTTAIPNTTNSINTTNTINSTNTTNAISTSTSISAAPTSTGTNTTYKFDRTFTFYALLPLSGGAASSGISQSRADQWAMDLVNSEGGIVVGGVRYKVALQTFDHAMDNTKSATLASMVISQYNAKYVATCTTGCTLTTQDIFAKNSVFVLANANPTIYTFGPKWPLTFADSPCLMDFGPTTYYPYFVNNLGIKTIALANGDNDMGRIQSAACKDPIKNNNYPLTILADEYYTPGTQDFSPLINKLLALNPDMIDMGGSTVGDFSLFCKQVREKGYKGYVSCMASFPDPATLWNVAGNASVGVYYCGFGGIPDPTPEYAAFRTKYEKTFNETMFTIVPYNYEHMVYLLRAINQANSFDPYKVASVLQDTTWKGMYGTVKYIGGQPGDPIALKRVPAMPIPLLRELANAKTEIMQFLGYGPQPITK